MHDEWKKFNLDGYCFMAPPGIRYVIFDHVESDKEYHVFFEFDEQEYRFKIIPLQESTSAQSTINSIYQVNAPLSRENWNQEPHRIQHKVDEVWICEYALMEGESPLRFFIAIFEKSGRVLELSFSANFEEYEAGVKLFDDIISSFSFQIS